MLRTAVATAATKTFASVITETIVISTGSEGRAAAFCAEAQELLGI